MSILLGSRTYIKHGSVMGPTHYREALICTYVLYGDLVILWATHNSASNSGMI